MSKGTGMLNQLFDAQQQFQLELLAKSNVVGVAVGYKDQKGEPTDELAIVALVERKLPIAALSAQDVVPKELDGARTDVFEIGYVTAQVNSGPRDIWRPTIPGGVSIAHPMVTAGTLGALVTDATTGDVLILSNNHVLANSNDAFANDPILQPGPTDGGNNPADVVARLGRFTPIRFIGEEEPDPTPDPDPDPQPPPPETGCDIASVFASIGNTIAKWNGSDKRLVVQGAASAASTPTMPRPTTATTVSAQASIPTNRIDAAVASPIDTSMFSNEILNIGAINGTIGPTLGMGVRKSGRTTGLTTGSIVLLNATVNVAYGPKTARFTGQIITTPMSQGGDSGSLVVDANSQNAVGLLFAGSPQATIFNPIDIVLSELNLSF